MLNYCSRTSESAALRLKRIIFSSTLSFLLFILRGLAGGFGSGGVGLKPPR